MNNIAPMDHNTTKNDSSITITDGSHLVSNINDTYHNDTDFLQKPGNGTNIEGEEVYSEDV